MNETQLLKLFELIRERNEQLLAKLNSEPDDELLRLHIVCTTLETEILQLNEKEK